jgi:hypothetical protein
VNDHTEKSHSIPRYFGKTVTIQPAIGNSLVGHRCMDNPAKMSQLWLRAEDRPLAKLSPNCCPVEPGNNEIVLKAIEFGSVLLYSKSN